MIMRCIKVFFQNETNIVKKKKDKKNENYLERIPKRPDKYEYSVGEDGIVTLQIENKGVFNTIAQKLFKKPSFISMRIFVKIQR